LVRAYVALGSNLDEPRRQVETAFDELAALSQTELVGRSALYGSTAVGPGEQPDYVNAAAALDTGLSAAALLAELQALENAHHRRRRQRWGPRTLDLDLLLYGDSTINTESLRVPHPRLAERNFVLYPLNDLDPELTIPGRGPLRELLAGCSEEGLWPLS
jgi:2-amino-4-hydroxy-6-hydroxymethyldihydropteridine diphosphokinase